MASNRTLKVSDLTYERVHSLKRGNETVDDVLRRALELETDSYDIENDLGAFLPEDVRRWAVAVAQQIDELADFDHKMARGEGLSGGDVLQFVLPDEGISVAKMDISEGSFIAHYRDNAGEWSKCFGSISEPRTESWDLDKKVLSQTQRHVSGSIRKWSGLSAEL
jgi:hypothetical protein